MELKKVFNNAITVCFSSNNNYFEYLVVCIHSIIKNTSKNINYDIVVLEKDITDDNKSILKKYQRDNISIRFYNISNILQNIDVNFNINYHFALENYFRLFIPEIFRNYKKVLYLDCDAVCLSDVAEIYNQDLDDNMIGAVKDFIVINQFLWGIDDGYYLNKLKLKNTLNYVNSGVLLLDIPKLLKFDFVNKSLNLMKIFIPKFVDQCVINKVAEGQIQFLNAKYNSSSALDELYTKRNRTIKLTEEVYSQYKQSLTNPCFVHFMSSIKPWNNLYIHNANLFWAIARETEVYEKILYKNKKYNIKRQKNYDFSFLKDVLNNPINKVRYYRYKLLSKITFGTMRKHYKKKRKELKTKLKEVKQFLRGNK